MASPSLSTALLLLSLLSFLAPAAFARPCKTLLISYTFSSSPSSDVTAFSASSIDLPQISASPRFYAFYRVIPLHFYPDPSAAAATEPLANTLRLPAGIHRPALPLPVHPSPGVSSLHERARDILVVVAGLLFGVGCGVLTSATIYLAWYLVCNRDEACGAGGYDYDEDDLEEGMESPKKRGYTDLPAAPATPVSPLKEGYEGH